MLNSTGGLNEKLGVIKAVFRRIITSENIFTDYFDQAFLLTMAVKELI